MPMLKNVLGLDLGSHSIKAAEFQQNLRGVYADLLCKAVIKSLDAHAIVHLQA